MATAVEQKIVEQGTAFQAYADRAFAVIGARANMWLSLQKTAAAYGITPTQVLGADLVQRHYDADKLAAKVGTAIQGLRAGTSEVIPVRIGPNGGEFLAVRVIGTMDGLGFWPIVLRVLQVATAAVLAGGGWQLSNAWLDVKKSEADAIALRADTAHKLAELAQQAPEAYRPALAQAAAEANKAAETGGPDWVDKLMQGIGTGATVAAGGGLLFLAIMFMLGRSKRRRNPPQRRRRVYRRRLAA